MDFIFMLTRHDRTIEDALAVLDEALAVGLRHIGFKDIGADRATLVTLNRTIKAAGAASYLEVVSTAPEDSLESARLAAEIGIDALLGGALVEPVLEILKGSETAYYPFPGTPMGHPTRLGGKPGEIKADCRRMVSLGCAGVDLLAYRAMEADPLLLVQAARAGLGPGGRLLCAGSIDSPARVNAIARAGADAFTIGSAIFDGSFSPRKGSLRFRFKDVLDAAQLASSNATRESYGREVTAPMRKRQSKQI